MREREREGEDLANVAEVVQGLSRKQVNRAYLPEHPPPWPIRREHKVLIVISNMLGPGVGRPAREVGVVGLQELRRHRGRRGHHHVHRPHPEVHQGAVLPRQGLDCVVGHRAQVGQVSDHRPRLRPRRERPWVAVAEAEEEIEEESNEQGVENKS